MTSLLPYCVYLPFIEQQVCVGLFASTVHLCVYFMHINTCSVCTLTVILHVSVCVLSPWLSSSRPLIVMVSRCLIISERSLCFWWLVSYRVDCKTQSVFNKYTHLSATSVKLHIQELPNKINQFVCVCSLFPNQQEVMRFTFVKRNK